MAVGCRHDQQAEVGITRAQQFLESRPDSSLVILNSIKDRMANWPRSQRMQYNLLYAQAQNKAYIAFTTDSITIELINYYKNNGTIKDRILANYMAGCAYRDLGDAPSALKYLNIAADILDTSDCHDNNLLAILMRIHSQMGYLYQNANEFSKALSEDLYAENIAWHIGDTISAIQLMWTRACGLYDSGREVNALDLLDSIEIIMRNNTKYEDPELIYPMKISYSLRNNDTIAASKLLSAYEQKMKFSPFSSDELFVDIAYLNKKGEYYTLTSKADSAIQLYQKLLQLIPQRYLLLAERYSLMSESYRGLMNAYSLKMQEDSVIKYANLFCIAYDSTAILRSSEQINHIQSLYNYSKIQEQSIKNVQTLATLRIAIVIFVVLCGLISVIIHLTYQKRIKKERQKLINVNQEYQFLIQNFERTTNELQLLKSNSEKFIQEKEKDIERLNLALLLYQTNTINIEQWNNERQILGCDIAKHLHKLSTIGKKATSDELDRLLILAKKAFPTFYSKITEKEKELSNREILICTLIRFQFIPSEISVLTNLSSQNITNIKSAINRKLFNTEGAKTLEANLNSIK